MLDGGRATLDFEATAQTALAACPGLVQHLIERAVETGAGATATVLIGLLDRSDASFEDRKPSLCASESNLAVANRRYGNMGQIASWRISTDDLEVPDDTELDLGWKTPEGELPHSYRTPGRTDGAFVDADSDLSGGCAGEVRT